jgi:hypothetical protein
MHTIDIAIGPGVQRWVPTRPSAQVIKPYLPKQEVGLLFQWKEEKRRDEHFITIALEYKSMSNVQ